MEENIIILLIAIVVLVYGYFSTLLARFNISGPMIFLGVGLLISPLGFGTHNFSIESELLQIIAEIALIVVLFSDAAELNIRKLRHDWSIPARLLFIALPLSIIFSLFVAKLFFPSELTLHLLLMVLILTPTDAALGKAVVTDKKLPEKIRSSINIESGLNDGIVFPLIITVIIIIISGQSSGLESGWGWYVFKQITLGTLYGVLIGFTGAKLAALAIKYKWMEGSYQNLFPIALAIFSYYLSEHFGGNGFIAAFFAGMLLGNYSVILKRKVEDFAQSEGELLILISFLIFGASFIPIAYESWNVKIFLYALSTLTFLRIIPVFISLIGVKFDFSTKLLFGWFGPRGIASLLYVMIVAHRLENFEAYETLFSVITLTITLSIFLHGVSAKPLVDLYVKNHNNGS